MTPREKEIQQALSELPENIQEAVENFNWSKEILAIARKYEIQIDDINILKEQTMLVIVGLEPASDYKDNLVEHMGINENLASQLVFESNENIFKELQRRMFFKEQHNELATTMKEEGIELIEEISKGNASSGTNTYYEPLDEDDYAGISGHRINIRSSQETSNARSSFEKNLFENQTISKGDTVRVKKEMSDEEKRKEYIDHLKNKTEDN